MSAKKIRPPHRYAWDEKVKTPKRSRVPDAWRIGTLKAAKLITFKSSNVYSYL